LLGVSSSSFPSVSFRKLYSNQPTNQPTTARSPLATEQVGGVSGGHRLPGVRVVAGTAVERDAVAVVVEQQGAGAVAARDAVHVVGQRRIGVGGRADLGLLQVATGARPRRTVRVVQAERRRARVALHV